MIVSTMKKKNNIHEDKSIHLTDEQYTFILKKARKNLDKIKKIKMEDSTEIGNKYTISNVGLCNDRLTTRDTALLPAEFPRTRWMLYRGMSHKCPLDGRQKPCDVQGWGGGCFYDCLLFNKKVKTISEIKELYDKRIREISNG